MYKEDPKVCHAKALVFVGGENLIRINRVATIAKKVGYSAKVGP